MSTPKDIDQALIIRSLEFVDKIRRETIDNYIHKISASTNIECNIIDIYLIECIDDFMKYRIVIKYILNGIEYKFDDIIDIRNKTDSIKDALFNFSKGITNILLKNLEDDIKIKINSFLNKDITHI